MASFQKTLNLDILNIRSIVPKGPNNTTIPQYAVLTADNNGATTWTSTFVGDGRQVEFVTAVALSTNTNYTIGSGSFIASSFIGDGSRITNVVATGLSTSVDYDIGSGSLTASTVTANIFYGDGSQLLNVVGDGLRVGSNYNIGDGSFTASTFTAETFIGNTFSGIAQNASNAEITSNLVYFNTYYMSSLNINNTINPPVIPSMVTPQPGINMYVGGATYLNGPSFMLSNAWQYDTNGNQRIVYEIQNDTGITGYNTTFGSPDGYVWNNYIANTSERELMRLTSTGVLELQSGSISSLNVSSISIDSLVVPTVSFTDYFGVNITVQNIRTNTLIATSFTTSTMSASTISVSSLTAGTSEVLIEKVSSLSVSSMAVFDGSISSLRVSSLTAGTSEVLIEKVSSLSVSSMAVFDGSISSLRVSSLTAGTSEVSIETVSSLSVSSMAVFDGSISSLRVSSLTAEKSEVLIETVSSLTAWSSEVSIETVSSLTVSSMTVAEGSIVNLQVSLINAITRGVTTIAGNNTSGFNGDFIGTNASFDSPRGVAVDVSGNIIVADTDNHRIRQIAPSGQVTTIAGNNTAGFNEGLFGTNARFDTPHGVTVDLSGNIIVADTNNHRIRKIAPNGQVTTIAGDGTEAFNEGLFGTNASFDSPTGVAVDVSGNIIVADRDNQRIRQIAPSGQVTTIAGNNTAGFNGDFIGTNAAFNFPRGVTLDVSGNIIVADTSNNRIRQIAPSGQVTTVAGNSTAGFNGDFIGTNASFNEPSGVTVDVSGNIIVADRDNNRIRQIAPSGQVTTIAGNSAAAFNEGLFGTNASFKLPRGVAIDLTGTIIVADTGNYRIRKIPRSGNVNINVNRLGVNCNAPEYTLDVNGSFHSLTGNITEISASSLTAGTSQISIETVSSLTVSSMSVFDGSISTLRVSSLTAETSEVSIETVSSLAVSSMAVFDGSISTLRVSSLTAGTSQISIERVSSLTVSSMTVADGSIVNLQVSSINAITYDSVTTIAGNNTSGFNGDSFGTNASFNIPRGVAVDVNGNIIVADTFNNRIRKIAPSGQVTTIAGDGTAGFNEGLFGTNASFWSPYDVALDLSGNIIVADTVNNRIRKIAPSGQVTTLAGDGTGAFNGDFIGTNTKFSFPIGIAVDVSGNIIVADTANSRIRKIAPSGQVTTIAGNSTSGFNGDSFGTNASFNIPRGVAVDVSGNIIVADTNNNRIRKIAPNGQVTTLAGDGTEAFNGDLIGTNTRFNSPYEVAVDLTGNIIVADTNNNRIRQISPSGQVTTLAGDGTAGFNEGFIGTNARFNSPSGVAVDVTGNIIVTDTTNNRIRKITTYRNININANMVGINCNAPQYTLDVNGSFHSLTGNITDVSASTLHADSVLAGNIHGTFPNIVASFAGQSGSPGTNDGTGTNARFNDAYGVAVDGSGTVYVADTANHLIRKIDASTGNVTTVAGRAGISSPFSNGIGTNATFAGPIGIAVDVSGNIYVGDKSNNLIRKIDASTAEVTTVAGQTGIPSPFSNGIGTNATFYDPGCIAVDGTGTIYVADSNYLIRKIDASTYEVTTLAGQTGISSPFSNGIGTNATFNNPTGLAVDSTGTLYVSDTYNNLIRIVNTSTGNVASFATSFIDPKGIAIDLSGNLYIVLQSQCYILKFTISTQEATIIAGKAGISSSLNGIGTNATFSSPFGIAVDPTGTLYVSEPSKSIIRVIYQDNLLLTANIIGITAKFIGINSTVPEYTLDVNGSFHSLSGNITDISASNLTAGTSQISIETVSSLRVSSMTSLNASISSLSVSTLIGFTSGISTFSSLYTSSLGVNCNAPQYTLDVNGSINSLSGSISTLRVSSLTAGTSQISIETVSSLTVSSMSVFDGSIVNLQVSSINAITYDSVTTIAGNGNFAFNGDLIGTNTNFWSPIGVAVDVSGNIIVADRYQHRIRKIAPSGQVTTVAGDGTGAFNEGLFGTNARFNLPHGVALDVSGNIIVADTGNCRIRKIAPSGQVTTIAGNANFAFNGDFIGTNTNFNYPIGIAVDVSGNIIVADTVNSRIRKIAPSGQVTTVAGDGTGAFNGDLIGTNASFDSPRGVAVDLSGNIIVADTTNNRIRQIAPNGQVTTIAGDGTAAFNGDLIGTNAAFNSPSEVTVDLTGNIIVADTTNNRIRKIAPSGQVTTIAGNDIAAFNSPFGVAVDVSGNIIVTDTGYNRIRKITTYRNININANRLGINCNAPEYTLDVNGSIHASGDVFAFSDRRLKTNIITIDSGLTLVNALRGVYYTRTDTNEPSLRHMGVIAQEVEQVLPEVVRTDLSQEQIKSVAYGNIVAVLIEGIKELSQRLAPLETLSTQVATLQSTLGSFIMQ